MIKAESGPYDRVDSERLEGHPSGLACGACWRSSELSPYLSVESKSPDPRTILPGSVDLATATKNDSLPMARKFAIQRIDRAFRRPEGGHCDSDAL